MRAGFAKRDIFTLDQASGKKRVVYKHFKQEAKNTVLVSLSVCSG